MYVIATVTLTNDAGEDETYEVGAEVTVEPGDSHFGKQYEVGEPDVSAPNGDLRTSRLAGDPQGVETNPLGLGWSAIVEDALIEAYQAREDDDYDHDDTDPDEYHGSDYMYGED